MELRTFNGDWDELARLIADVWGTHFGDKTHFNYPPAWLAGFFSGGRELAIEYRNPAGELTGFLGAAPRRYLIHGRDVRLGLVTLLTSARHNTVGMVGLELERELFQRARAMGLYGTYHFCLDGQRTPDLLRFAASTIKTRAVEVESATSLIGLARAYDGTEDVRPATADDAGFMAELIERAGSTLPISRRVTAAEFRAGLDDQPPKRALALLRDGQPIGLCVYARRRLLGKDPTEVANLDLLIAPDATKDEARRFGRAIATDAAAHGAAYLIAPQRATTIFPFAREAGLRLSPRTLRVFIVPSLPEHVVERGSAHLLEVE